MLGSRYQYVSLANLSFQRDIFTMSIEFTIIPKVEAKLTVDNVDFDFNTTFLTDIISNRPSSSTSLSDTVYIIAIGAVQTEKEKGNI